MRRLARLPRFAFENRHFHKQQNQLAVSCTSTDLKKKQELFAYNTAALAGASEGENVTEVVARRRL